MRHTFKDDWDLRGNEKRKGFPGRKKVVAQVWELWCAGGMTAVRWGEPRMR